MKNLLALAFTFSFALPLASQERIEDNSFLIEEAYNQERGIVQHVSAFVRSEGGDWEYSFTQEWPFLGQQNQLSYTLPFASISDGVGGSRTRIGDIALNYRRQLAGIGGGRVAFSPRLSLLLPTGDETSGHGSGGIGVETNLPLSVVLTDRIVTHYNAGFAITPRARNAAGDEANVFGFHLGSSAILILTARLNLMLEGLWSRTQAVVGGDLTDGVEEVFLNPGVRYAIDTRGGLQIVPGVAYLIGIGPSSSDTGLFLYLSLEHSFRRSAAQD